MDAKVITVDHRPSQDRNAETDINLPVIDMFFGTNATTALSQLSVTTGHLTQQKFLALWMQRNNPLVKHVKTVIQPRLMLLFEHE